MLSLVRRGPIQIYNVTYLSLCWKMRCNTFKSLGDVANAKHYSWFSFIFFYVLYLLICESWVPSFIGLLMALSVFAYQIKKKVGSHWFLKRHFMVSWIVGFSSYHDFKWCEIYIFTCVCCSSMKFNFYLVIQCRVFFNWSFIKIKIFRFWYQNIKIIKKYI